MVRLTVAYLNATVNVKPKTQNRGLAPTGLPKPGGTRRLMGTGLGCFRLESAGWGFGRVWNRIYPVVRFKSRPLACYPDPFLTLDNTERSPNHFGTLEFLPTIYQWTCSNCRPNHRYIKRGWKGFLFRRSAEGRLLQNMYLARCRKHTDTMTLQ